LFLYVIFTPNEGCKNEFRYAQRRENEGFYC
jgi:hypothetical protein